MKLLRYLIALFRLNKRIVCEMSDKKHDFHDYPDSTEENPEPWHFYQYTCRRCGKKFYL